MKKVLNRLWSSPFSVKLSASFLSVLFLVALIADPGRVLFIIAFMYALFKIIDWFWDAE